MVNAEKKENCELCESFDSCFCTHNNITYGCGMCLNTFETEKEAEEGCKDEL